MHIEETGIPGLLVLTPARFGDARGFFSETWNRARLSENGIDIDFVQDNHSLSAAVGTVRGLHFQAPPHAQAKLVRCGRGALFDVAVDIRKGSPTYGRKMVRDRAELRERQAIADPGGFRPWLSRRARRTPRSSTSAPTLRAGGEGALRYDDPDIGIDWGLGDAQAILSDKDAAAPAFAGFDSPFVYEESVA
jgi:dTDP-4-dehydrorhamnose 3,5-epimerase